MKRRAIMGAVLSLAASPAAGAEFGKYGMSGLRIAVKDEAKSIEFYKRLGMKVGRLYHPGQQEMTWNDQKQGPNVVLVTIGTNNSKLVPGTASFMMYVPSVATTAKDLRGAGFAGVEDPKPSKSDYTILLIKDPDGNQVELIGPTPK